MTISKIVPVRVTTTGDTFDESKGYNRVLFRPSVGVQVRELNEVQSILQAQVDYLGQYTFQDGAVVLGGDLTAFSRDYVRLNGTVTSEEAQAYVGKTVVGATDGLTAVVTSSKKKAAATYLYLSYSNSGTAGTQSTYNNSESLTIDSVAAAETVSTADDSKGEGSFVSITEGVYFYSGYFIYVPAATINLDEATTAPSYEVGFSVTESMIDSTADTALVDNSAGAPNESAPGANREQFTTVLSKFAIDASTGEYVTPADVPAKWIPHTKIINGVVVKKTALDNKLSDTPLSDKFEQRTYEESGDYTLGAFRVAVREDKLETIDGESNLGNITSGSADKYVLDINPSVAYVKGRRVEKAVEKAAILGTASAIDKTRTTDSIKTYSTKYSGVTSGNYFDVTINAGIPPRANAVTLVAYSLELMSGGDGSGGGTTTKIGSCVFKSIEFMPGTNLWRVYVTNIVMNAGQTIGSVTVLEDDGDSTFIATISGKLKEASNDTAIVKLPFDNTKTLLDGSSADNTTFISRITAVSTSGGSSGVAAVTVPTGYELASVDAAETFETKYDGSSSWSVATAVTGFSGTPSIGDSNFSILTTGTAGVRVSFLIRPAAGTKFKTKTKVVYHTDIITYAAGTSTYELDFADGIYLEAVYAEEGTAGGTGHSAKTVVGAVTDSYTFVASGSSGIEVDDIVYTTGTTDIDKKVIVTAIDSGTNTVTVDRPVTLTNSITVKFKSITDHSDKFIFDSGQRASSYELASITLNPAFPNASITNGSLVVRYSYYSHGAGSYFSVDSYPNEDYDVIPAYNGVELRDCLDFRFVTPTFSGPWVFPEIGSSITLAEPQVYMGRKDILYLDNNGEYVYRKGIPALSPVAPSNAPVNAITLFNIDIKPYVYDLGRDISFTSVNNQGYTMEAIRGLESNIEQLQYYVAAQAVGNNDNSDLISGSTQKGLAIDNFSSQVDGIGDPSHPDYDIAMVNGNKLVPPFRQTSVNLVKSAGQSGSDLAYPTAGGAITVPYATEKVEVSQDKDTATLPINANGITGFRAGDIQLSPPSDIWMSDASLPEPINNDWAKYTVSHTYSGRYYRGYRYHNSVRNSILLSGTNRLIRSAAAEYRVNQVTGEVQLNTNGSLQNWRKVGTATPGQANLRLMSYSRNFWGRVFGYNYSVRIVRDHKYNTGPVAQLVPDMRSREVYFKATDLRPGTQVYAFFDGHDVSSYVKKVTKATYDANIFGNADDSSETIQTFDGDTSISDLLVNAGSFETGITYTITTVGTTDFTAVGSANNTVGTVFTATGVGTGTGTATNVLKTESDGKVYGVFLIPNNESIRVKCGAAKLILTSSSTNANTRSTSGVVNFYSGMADKEISEAIAATGTSKFDNNYSVDDLTDFQNWNTDAIAQVFKVRAPDVGASITKITIYPTTSSGELPLRAKLVTTKDGVPTRNVIPGTNVEVAATDVTAAIAAGSLDLVFDWPIALKGTSKYALVLYSNSSAYNVKVAKDSNAIAEDSSKYSFLPEGIEFLQSTSNSRSWSSLVGQSLKFKVTRAVFNTDEEYTYQLVNDGVEKRLLQKNPFRFTAGASTTGTIVVSHPNHGFYGTGHTVTFSGCRDFNNVTAAEFNAEHTVVRATQNYYEIDLTGLAGTPVNEKTGGGRKVRATENRVYDMIAPTLDIIEPVGTSTGVKYKGTSTKTVDSTGLSFARDGSFVFVNNNALNVLDKPCTVLSTENQDLVSPSGKSLKFKAKLQTTNDRVSPIVNLNASHAVLHSHSVNYPSSPTVADTAAYGTDSVANYITKKLDLDSISSALDIYVDVSKPEDAAVEVYYKTSIDFDKTAAGTSWDDLGWTQITDTAVSGNIKASVVPSTIPTTGNVFMTDNSESAFNEIHFTVEDTAASPVDFVFNSVAIKIVLKSKNSAEVPACKNLRIFASS